MPADARRPDLGAQHRMRTGTEGSFAVPMLASIQGDTAPLLTRGAGGVGDRRDGEAVSRPAASSWLASVARSRVAAAMALLLLALVALLSLIHI